MHIYSLLVSIVFALYGATNSLDERTARPYTIVCVCAQIIIIMPLMRFNANKLQIDVKHNKRLV